MMPTNPIGPPTETAAPVASEALKNATRCARATSRPRDSALSGPSESRFSGRASQANATNATTDERQRREERLIAADVEIAHQPAQRPVGVGEAREVLDEQDHRREERVHRHAGEQQDGRRQPAMPRLRQRVDDADGGQRAGERGQRHRRDADRTPSDQLNVMASIAPSAAPADTPSVNGVASGLRSSPWKTTPAAASVRADERAGERARQPRDEEDLRVGVVGERNREIERPPQADRRRADERRERRSRRWPARRSRDGLRRSRRRSVIASDPARRYARGSARPRDGRTSAWTISASTP